MSQNIKRKMWCIFRRNKKTSELSSLHLKRPIGAFNSTYVFSNEYATIGFSSYLVLKEFKNIIKKEKQKRRTQHYDYFISRITDTNATEKLGIQEINQISYIEISWK